MPRQLFHLIALAAAAFVFLANSVGGEGESRSRSYSELPACKMLRLPGLPSEGSVQLSGEATAMEGVSSSSTGRIVVIGDIHGTREGLHEILVQSNLVDVDDVDCTWSLRAANRETILVQMGDLVDRGAEALEAMQCLDRLYSSMKSQGADADGSNMIRIIGNHEVWWLEGRFHMRNKAADTKANVLAMVRMMKDQVARGEMVGAYTIAVNGVDLLFVHAGYRASYLAHLEDSGVPNARSAAQEVVRRLNEELPRVVSRCMGEALCDFDDDPELFQAGPERGGNHLGGPLWTDFRVLEDDDRRNGAAAHSNAWIQIVGHSATDSCDDGDDSNGYFDLAHCKELIRATRDMEAVCVDGGMVYGTRSYLEIDRASGRWVAHEGKHSLHEDGGLAMEWGRRELNSRLCGGVSA